MGETYRRTNSTATLHQSGLDGKVTKLKLLLSKDMWNHDWNLQKYTQITLRVWKKKNLMNLNSLYQAPLLTCIIPSQRWSMVAAASCSGGVFQWQGLGKWSEKTESWMQLNTDIHNENLVQSTQNLRLGWKFTFQHDPTHTVKTMQEWLGDDSMNVLEWPRLGGNQTSLEKPIHGCPPMVPSQPDRVWDHLKRRKAQPKKVQSLSYHTPKDLRL